MSNGRQFYIDTLISQFREVISVTKSFLENEIYISTKKENLVEVCIVFTVQSCIHLTMP